ncbi:hypothetical protein NDU88_004751 [Pleurodeles waltl]|uniref:Uncharacterized protein n=1 Tax=Pleurodeles waltl TaxID=8319 RepID=A0AAV7W5V6_PLEWA|nr:hypothetical protein NDU88_004751 [Pleurodeles waltl]
MLADIRRSVAALAAPASDVPTQALPIAQGVAPGASAVTEQGQAARAHPGASQDLTTQTLVSVSQMLANLTVPVPTPHPTTPWASDPLQNSVLELKRQVEALVAARNVPSLQVATSGPSVSQAPGPLSQTPPGGKEHGKVIEQGGNTIVTPAEVTGADTLLSRPGKLAAHVASEIKEKIWKGDFVDIFSLELEVMADSGSPWTIITTDYFKQKFKDVWKMSDLAFPDIAAESFDGTAIHIKGAVEEKQWLECDHEDLVLQEVKEYVRYGWRSKERLLEEIAPYFKVRDELEVENGLVFKRGRDKMVERTVR